MTVGDTLPSSQRIWLRIMRTPGGTAEVVLARRARAPGINSQSESSMTNHRPRAWATVVARAAEIPPLRSWVTIRRRGSSIDASTCDVVSVEASSTTTISRSLKLWSRQLRIARATSVGRLYAVISTLKNGWSAIDLLSAVTEQRLPGDRLSHVVGPRARPSSRRLDHRRSLRGARLGGLAPRQPQEDRAER